MADLKLDRQTAQLEISRTPFLAGLPSTAIAKVTARISTRVHPPDQVILLENDWGNSVFFVLRGWVKIRTYNLDGKEITLNVLGNGEMFGEMAPLDRVPRSTDVITLTEAAIASLPATDFMELVESEPQAALRLARLLAQRLRQLNRRLRLREADSGARVADILLFFAESQGIKTQRGIEIPSLPHRELSSMSGLARETVTRVMGKLEKKGVVQRFDDRDTLCIPDIQILEELVI
jgi:CRP-like cAMP-binding protein